MPKIIASTKEVAVTTDNPNITTQIAVIGWKQLAHTLPVASDPIASRGPSNS